MASSQVACVNFLLPLVEVPGALLSAPELDEFLYEPFYQIMRQRLLADRMVHQRELDVVEAKVVVVVPEQNQSYRVIAQRMRDATTVRRI